MTTMWRTRRKGSGAGWLEALTTPTARAMAPRSTTATIAVRRWSGAAIRASFRLGVVGGHDHRFEGEVVAGPGIGRHPHPVDVGTAEGLEPGEVREEVGLVDE